MTGAARTAWTWSFALVLASCTENSNKTSNETAPTDMAEPSPPPASTAPLFAPSTTRVAFEVDYATGAEPVADGDAWRILGDSVSALFDGAKEVEVPSALEAMERLDDVPAGSFTTADLLAIAARHRDTTSGAGTAAFYVVFVDGVYVDPDGAPQPNVFGLSIGTTGVIAIFKPVIARAAARGGSTPAFVEQSALVHEVGHAAGLVDLGVPATTAHVDPDHPHHCSSTTCVMHWAKESASAEAAEPAERESRVLFGPECLADARAFAAALE